MPGLDLLQITRTDRIILCRARSCESCLSLVGLETEDQLFENNVPARQFKKQTVNAFERDHAKLREIQEELTREDERVIRGA
jgi:hypothetical protein